jgi:hypothetical protein
MGQVKVEVAPPPFGEPDVLAFPVREDENSAFANGASVLDERVNGRLRRLAAEGELRGELGRTLVLHTDGEVDARRVAPVGIGKSMGAMITMKQMPHNAWREARLAIAGPILGSLGALVLYVLGVAYDSHDLKALAFLGFFINLFNLLPIVPLDGGRVTAALHPALWLVGFLGLLGLVIWKPNPILIIILLFSASELWRRWQMRGHPEMQEYYRVKPHQRLIVGVLYFGLAILLVLGMHATHVPRTF